MEPTSQILMHVNSSKAKSSPIPFLVSVVIPSYNRLTILPRCLNALSNQTYPNYEIIVVDNGSTDGTPRFLDAFAVDHPTLKLRWFLNEQNLGANAGRNRGIREAQGELVAFLDSDCIAEPDWLAELAAGFENENVASVTGQVKSVEPTNIYELAYKGNERVYGRREAPRLVAGNMCIRRDLLFQYPLDEDLTYGCDEEGLYLRFRAAGYRQWLVPDAVVWHDHPYTGKTFFRQARVVGCAAAWLVYKYHLSPRLDMLPFLLGYLTLPVGLVDLWLLRFPAFFFMAALAALIYNELFRKGKTVAESLLSLPVLLAFYHVKLQAYVTESLRLRLFSNDIKRIRLPKGEQNSSPQSG